MCFYLELCNWSEITVFSGQPSAVDAQKVRLFQRDLNVPHLLLVSGLVYFLLQDVHLLERVQAVDAVDEDEAVRHGVVMLGEVLAVVEPFGVVEPQLLLHAAIGLHRGHVHILLGLVGLGPLENIDASG